MNTTFKRVLALLFSLLTFVCTAYCEDTIEEISANIVEIESGLSQSEPLISELEGEAQRLRERAKVARTKSERLVAESEETKRELMRLRGEIEVLTEKRNRLREHAPKRLRSLYMTKVTPKDGLTTREDQLLTAQSVAYYLTVLNQYDSTILRDLAHIEDELKKREENFSKLLAHRKMLAGNAEDERRRADQLVADLNQKLNQLLKERSNQEELLLALRARALRLETVISGLTADPPKTMARLAPSPTVADKDPVSRSPQTPFKGRGLFVLKGSLLPPVEGELVGNFGKIRAKTAREIVASNGLAFNTPSESKVRAIATGKVVHIGELPAYGKFLILDHGKRYYSLYGRLSRIGVSAGEIVERGDELGLSSLSDSRVGNFYFEIRHQGKPVNPNSYYNRPF